MSEAAAPVLSEVPTGWDALVAGSPSASPTHRVAVWEAFAAVLPGFEWRFLAHHEGGVLIGGLPVMLVRRGPFTRLDALPWLLPAPPLAAAGSHARVDAGLCAAFAALAREQRVIGGAWSLYRPEGPEVAPAALELVPGLTRRFDAAILRLDRGRDAVYQAMSRKQRQALEHSRARALVFAEDPEALDEAHALHLAQSRHWSGHRPLPLELSRRLLASRPSDGRPVARLFTLRSSAGLVSATLALDGEHETFLWWSGTHERGRHVDAFTHLVWEVTGWAVSHGRRRLNLGASPGLALVASYKRSLGAEAFSYPTRWLDARHAPWSLRLLHAAKRGLRPRPEGAAT